MDEELVLLSKEFLSRRRRLLDALPPNAIAILFAATEKVRSRDTHFPFRQDSDFYYLTGFNEPDAVAVFMPGHSEGDYCLFIRDQDARAAQWEGERASIEMAEKIFGADKAYPLSQLNSVLPELLQHKSALYCFFDQDEGMSSPLQHALAEVHHQNPRETILPQQHVDLASLVHPMRLIKSLEEQECMRRVCDISAKAHVAAMQSCRPGCYEYQLEGVLLSHFLRQGCRSVAYNSIVASGNNACVLHYVNNDQKIGAEDLVLIDAGAEYEYYAADITRTFPASGKFNDRQRALYEVVLQAQLAGISEVKPNQPWNGIQERIVKVLTEGLVDLGILKGRTEDLLETQAYKEVYMHSSGHWLGLDVHDVGSYRNAEGQSMPLQAGMVLTVEPGIYISPTCSKIDAKWHGIGIRIEDDVLVTAQGNEVLTAAAPKQVDDIEHHMKQCGSPVL